MRVSSYKGGKKSSYSEESAFSRFVYIMYVQSEISATPVSREIWNLTWNCVNITNPNEFESAVVLRTYWPRL